MGRGIPPRKGTLKRAIYDAMLHHTTLTEVEAVELAVAKWVALNWTAYKTKDNKG